MAVLAAGLLAVTMPAATATEDLRQVFSDPRQPPTVADWPAGQRAAFELGQAVFNTSWVVAGTPRAQRRDGLGPVFNAASCDACHNNGARLRGLPRAGPLPTGMVMQLGAADGSPAGDPVYGQVLNTSAIAGHRAEGEVALRYVAIDGRYPDGRSWQLREPRYVLGRLAHGPVSLRTVLRPRAAPALFGAGLLDAAMRHGGPGAAGFGWQGDAGDLRRQTARAFSHEMGVTSHPQPADDCAAADGACRDAPNGGDAEVSDTLFDAVVAFQRGLAVPRPPQADAGVEREGGRLFDQAGCTACHLPALAVDGGPAASAIAAYTDLRTHDLGPGLADRDARGAVVPSRWRTAPLWGIGYALAREGGAALLHDGRARTLEEAVLWHDGEAGPARRAFERLQHKQRQRLLRWLAQR